VRNWYNSKVYSDLKALISHEVESFDLIERVVKEFKPQFIVELGSAFYGLTLLLHECNRSTPIFTFDLVDPLLNQYRSKGRVKREDVEHLLKAFRKSVNFIKGDVIDKKNKFLIALLKMSERKLFYSDNGNKEREIVYYAPYLNKGDLLGVHDWGTEVDPSKSEIRKVLSLFDPHYLNQEFQDRKLLTRFFIKVR
jgi:cephalosporin hydroxylase